LTQLKTRQIVSSLTSKGFREAAGDHQRFIYYFEGRKTEIRTMVSRGSREIGDGLIHAMARQTKLSKEEFVELVSCTLGSIGYAEKLRAVGLDLRPAA
jgi:predicted RNA binding protein YcfA (HicA-like mRNA interferase family)